MLWVYDQYNYSYSYSAVVDFRRRNLTSTDVRFWQLNSIPFPRAIRVKVYLLSRYRKCHLIPLVLQMYARDNNFFFLQRSLQILSFKIGLYIGSVLPCKWVKKTFWLCRTVFLCGGPRNWEIMDINYCTQYNVIAHLYTTRWFASLICSSLSVGKHDKSSSVCW